MCSKICANFILKSNVTYVFKCFVTLRLTSIYTDL